MLKMLTVPCYKSQDSTLKEEGESLKFKCMSFGHQQKNISVILNKPFSCKTEDPPQKKTTTTHFQMKFKLKKLNLPCWDVQLG